MKVGVNGRALCKSQTSGVGQYVSQLVSELSDARDGYDLSIKLYGAAGVEDAPVGVETTGANAPPSGPLAHLWEQFALPVELSGAGLDIFHASSGLPPVIADTPLVTTIHDISPVTHPEWFSPAYSTLYRIVTPIAIRASDRIITVSDFVRDEVVNRYSSAKGKTVRVYNGVVPMEHDGPAPYDELEPDGYLLFVGAVNPRKNIDGLLQAYERYRDCVDFPRPLVLVGPSDSVFAEQDLPEVPGVHNFGFVSDEELSWLYSNAALLVFPSLYEGFGLPIVEAMRVGTPVLTSDRGAMKEIAGNAGHLIDPTNATAISDGILEVLANREYRDTLSQRAKRRSGAFTWSKTAKQTYNVYQSVIEESER